MESIRLFTFHKFADCFSVAVWFIVTSLINGMCFLLKERMARIEQEEKEEHERKKKEAEKKKHDIEKAEEEARKRKEEDVDDSKMVRTDLAVFNKVNAIPCL